MIDSNGTNLGIGSWPARRARIRPDDVAIVFEGTETTYRTLDERVTRLARAFRAAGVARGDRVAYVGFNHPALLETYFALGLLGAAIVLVNPRLSGPEIDYILEDSGAGVVAFGADLRRLLTDSEADVRLWLDVDGQDRDGTGGTPGEGADVGLGTGERSPGPSVDFEAFLRAGDATPVDEPVGLEELAMIMYTSGTTGRPKGVMLSHQNLFYQYVNALIGQDMRQDEVYLAAAPLFHIAGLNVVAVPTITMGGRIIIHRSFRPEAVLQEISTSKVTSTFMVPAMMEGLSQREDFAAADLSSLRTLLVGGAPVPERLLSTWQDRGVAVMQGYGMTEAAPGVGVLEARDGIERSGSAGVGQFFTENRIVAADGTDVPRGEHGEVIVRGPNVMMGYWNNPEATQAAVRDGWYHTGDIGEYDADGYLYIRDRIKDMYISGGENVYPAEVENALLHVPGIVDAAVIGVPDDRWGETGRAFVIVDAATGPTEETIRRELGSRLARYKQPRDVEVVDDLPRTTSGKIQKHLLRTPDSVS